MPNNRFLYSFHCPLQLSTVLNKGYQGQQVIADENDCVWHGNIFYSEPLSPSEELFNKKYILRIEIPEELLKSFKRIEIKTPSGRKIPCWILPAIVSNRYLKDKTVYTYENFVSTSSAQSVKTPKKSIPLNQLQERWENTPTPVRLEKVLEVIEKCKGPDFEGWYKGLCPSHDDNNPSMSFIEDEDTGRVFFHCFAGCSWKEILKAINERLGV